MSTESILPETPPYRPRRGWLAIVVWFYVAIVLGWWLALRYAGDRWWPATMMLFAPRWPVLLPMIVLMPMVIFARQRRDLTKDVAWPRRLTGGVGHPGLVCVLFILAGLIAGPIMGFHAARLPRHAGDTRADLRVMTLNTHFESIDVPSLRGLIAEERPDVIAFQEWDSRNNKPLLGDNTDYPYRVPSELALLASRYPARPLMASRTGIDPSDGIFYGYTVTLPSGPIELYNVHLASPHNSLSEVVHGGKTGVNRLRRNADARWNEAMMLGDLADRGGDSVVLAGDFNLPSDSPVFRKAFYDLTDAFTAAGLGYGWTYRTNRTNVRIDHILTGTAWLCRSAWVGQDVGSPHRPLFADLQRAGK